MVSKILPLDILPLNPTETTRLLDSKWVYSFFVALEKHTYNIDSFNVSYLYLFTSDLGHITQYPVNHMHGPLVRHLKLRVAHASRTPGTFSLPPRFSDLDMHHGTCVTHVPWCIPGLLISGFLWSRGRGKSYRHSRRMRNPQCNVLGKSPLF